MTEGTCNRGLQVARLDRNERPEGYIIRPTSFAYCFIDPTGNAHASSMDAHGHGWSRDTALERAWAHYEREHNPPGMWVESGGFAEDDVVFWGVGHERDVDNATASTSYEAARAAAWAHYWKRLELVRRMEALTDPRYRLQAPGAWPEVLAWSDEQVSQVEKDLAEAEAKDAAKPPAPVRELGKPAPNRHIIEYLERLLAEAKAGEVSSVACAAVLTGRRTLRHYVVGETGMEHAALVGLIEQIKFDVMKDG